MMSITLKEIAEIAGVSPTTVSLILNEKKCRVSSDTRERVQKIAQEHNYTANLVARSLVTRKSMVIGLIIPDIENPFFSSLCKHVETFARALDYTTIIVNSNDLFVQDVNLINLLVSRGVDGMLIVLSNESFNRLSDMKMILDKIKIPFVLLDRYHTSLQKDSVHFDNAKGVYHAIKHLYENGHRNIACIGIKDNSKNGLSRIDGFINAMDSFQLDVNEANILDGNYKFDGGYQCGEAIKNSDVSAVFICNDMMTLGFMDSYRKQGLKVPKDISLISYDDTIALHTQYNYITSIHQDVVELSKSAIELLEQKMKNPHKASQEIVLVPELVVRTSVRKNKK